MKEQFRASAAQLEEYIESYEQSSFDDYQSSGLGPALKAISIGLKDLRNSGIDVRLNLNPVKTENGLSLIFKQAKSSVWMAMSGTLEIQGSKILVAITEKEKDSKTGKNISGIKIYISQYEGDYFEGKYTGSDPLCFNLSTDKEAILKLQKHIIDIHLKWQALKAHDPENTLTAKNPHPTKLNKAKTPSLP